MKDRVASSGLVLTHGAGGDSSTPILVEIEKAVAPMPVHRFDFPYRREGRRWPPDRAPKLIDCIRTEATEFARTQGLDPASLIFGGRSMGGRMCSMALADDLAGAGLILLSYPLHPPGKPTKLRVDHFASIDVPCLFVMGDRDPFGSRAEFEAHLATIPAPVELVWLKGADHSPKSEHFDAIAAAVTDFIEGIC